MTTCKGPHTEGNEYLQTTHFSAAILDLVSVNVWVANSWVVVVGCHAWFSLNLPERSGLHEWLEKVHQKCSYQLVMLILGCNRTKISCTPKHLHPKTISTNPRWIPIDETTCGWGQQKLSLWQAFKNTACHVLFTNMAKPPWSICKHLKIQSKNWVTLVHVNMRLHCKHAWWRSCQFEYWSWSYITCTHCM